MLKNQKEIEGDLDIDRDQRGRYIERMTGKNKIRVRKKSFYV